MAKFVCGKCGRLIRLPPRGAMGARRIRALRLECRCGATPTVKLVNLHKALEKALADGRDEIVVGGGPRARRHGGRPDVGN